MGSSLSFLEAPDQLQYVTISLDCRDRYIREMGIRRDRAGLPTRDAYLRTLVYVQQYLAGEDAVFVNSYTFLLSTIFR